MNKRIFYNGEQVNVGVYIDNTHIEDSYKIKRIKDMRNVLELIRNTCSNETLLIHKLKLSTQIHEWRAHNLLYALNIQRKRTKDVDINNNPWYIRCAYFVLSCLYLRF